MNWTMMHRSVLSTMKLPAMIVACHRLSIPLPCQWILATKPQLVRSAHAVYKLILFMLEQGQVRLLLRNATESECLIVDTVGKIREKGSFSLLPLHELRTHLLIYNSCTTCVCDLCTHIVFQ